MKNLEKYGVQEMNAQDIRDIDGGGILVVIAIVIGLTTAGHFVMKNAREKNKRNGQGSVSSRSRRR